MKNNRTYKSTFLESAIICITMIFSNQSVGGENLKKGMSFLQARKMLIADHWTPVAKDTEPVDIGIERELKKLKIVEVESCAIDRAICIFNYKKEKRCLRVFARGEETQDLTIEKWTNDCIADVK